LVEQLARLPKPGEKITFHGVELVAEAVDRRRVLQVKVTLPDSGTSGDNPSGGTGSLGSIGVWALVWITALGLAGCSSPDFVPRPKGYFRIALHDTLYQEVELDCPLALSMSKTAFLQPVKAFAPDSCWFNLVYPEYKARIHCTYAGGVELEPVLEDAFSLAYEHEVKADAIEVRRRDFDHGGMNLTWRIAGNAASPFQFLCTDGSDRFLRGALYFELRPNADSLAPVVARLTDDMDHLISQLDWK